MRYEDFQKLTEAELRALISKLEEAIRGGSAAGEDRAAVLTKRLKIAKQTLRRQQAAVD